MPSFEETVPAVPEEPIMPESENKSGGKMRVMIDNFVMAYADSGGADQPVLFVHGYPLNRQMWLPQVQALADVARVLAPDLRGHGESQATLGTYSMDLLADDLALFLDALGIGQPVVLCGLSMGGYVAMAFYRRYAARLAGLILTATRSAADSPEARQNRDRAALQARQGGVTAITEAMLPKLLSPHSSENKPELVEYVRAMMMATSMEAILGDLEGLKSRPDSTQMLAELRLPTLIIHGADDQIIPVEEARTMHNAIPDSRLEILPEAGHLPNLEQPERFNGVVRQFLQAQS